MTYTRSPLPPNPYIQKVQTPPLYLLYMCLEGAVCPAGAVPPATRPSTPTPTRSGRTCLPTSIKSYQHPLPDLHKVVHNSIPKGVCFYGSSLGGHGGGNSNLERPLRTVGHQGGCVSGRTGGMPNQGIKGDEEKASRARINNFFSSSYSQGFCIAAAFGRIAASATGLSAAFESVQWK